MRGFLYLIWCLLPLFFFGVALWSKLESISNKKKDNTSDFVRTGLFTTLCVTLAIIIDQYILEGLVDSYSPDALPLWFYQVLLLPALLVVAAKIIGPSAAIRIGKKGAGRRGQGRR